MLPDVWESIFVLKLSSPAHIYDNSGIKIKNLVCVWNITEREEIQ
jgi:hypothetical protein